MDIKINNLYKSYGENIVFEDFNITFKENTINTIIGKSGCGKTTLLKILTNIIKDYKGDIEGVDKEIGYIFQEDRLIDWLTVKDNLKFVLKKYYKNSELDKICRDYLELVGIEEYENKYPQELSGGMRQRVNIARAFSIPSKLIIMDEPFKSIDIKNKSNIMESFKNAMEKEKRTVIFVTHDLDEAFYFNGYIHVFNSKTVKINEELSGEIEKINKQDIIDALFEN